METEGLSWKILGAYGVGRVFLIIAVEEGREVVGERWIVVGGLGRCGDCATTWCLRCLYDSQRESSKAAP